MGTVWDDAPTNSRCSGPSPRRSRESGTFRAPRPHRAASARSGGGRRGLSCLWNDADQVLVPQAWTRMARVDTPASAAAQRGPGGTVAARREGLIVNDYRHCSGEPPRPGAHPRHRTMAEPLVYRDSLVGVIVVDTEEAGAASPGRIATPFHSWRPMRPSPSRTHALHQCRRP